MVTRCESIDTPKTLKAGLEFLSKLNDLRAASTLGKALEDKVKGAIKKLEGENIKLEESFTKEITKNFNEVLTKASELRSVIVNHGTSYGGYQDIDIRECDDKCANTLLEFLPKLYCTLSYLVFQVSGSFTSRGGGGWETQTCKERFNEDTYLYEWLVDTKGIAAWKSSKDTLLPCGFNSAELSDKYGHELHSVLLGFVDDEEDLAHLPKLLYDIVFATQLTTAGSATALVVTAAFCTAVSEKEFSEENVESQCTSLTDVCSSVVATLNRIVPRTATASNLMACEGAVDYFIRILKSGGFGACIGWLKDNLEGIIQNLQKMGTTCKDWDKNMLEYGEYAGPFPYGFMFGSAWKGSTITARSRLSQFVERLTTPSPAKSSLLDLLQCLKSDENIIVNNEQPQQETPAAEAVGAAANVAAASGISRQTAAASSTPASGVVQGGGGDSVATAATEVQTGQNNGIESGETVSSPVESSPTNSDIGDKGQRGATVPNDSPKNEASVTNSTSETGNLNTRTDNAGVSLSSDQTPAQSGSSGIQSDLHHVDGEAADDNSTVTIGSAAGGVALLGGGGAALYFLNVGGIKTLITGVP